MDKDAFQKLIDTISQSAIPLHKENESYEALMEDMKDARFVGVIYRPDTERFSHYFFTHLPYQFDYLIHFDKTSAVKPLTM